VSDHRTKARLIVNVFQSALRAKIEAENNFVLAHDQLGKLLDNLIAENEELRSVAEFEGTRQMRTEELNALRIKLGLIQAREVKP
jgi:hypothetical protein